MFEFEVVKRFMSLNPQMLYSYTLLQNGALFNVVNFELDESDCSFEFVEL